MTLAALGIGFRFFCSHQVSSLHEELSAWSVTEVRSDKGLGL